MEGLSKFRAAVCCHVRGLGFAGALGLLEGDILLLLPLLGDSQLSRSLQGTKKFIGHHPAPQSCFIKGRGWDKGGMFVLDQVPHS